MTYCFFQRFLNPRAASWATALWLSAVFMAMVALSSLDEGGFIYLDF